MPEYINLTQNLRIEKVLADWLLENWSFHEEKGHLTSSDREPKLSLFVEAVNQGNIQICNLLISVKVDPNIQDTRIGGKTALMLAILNNNVDIALLLINYEKIDLNARDNNGKTALHYAVESESFQIYDVLLTFDTLDTDIQDNNGETPLHSAAHKDNDYMTKELLREGALMSIKNSSNFSPYDYASDRLKKLFENVQKSRNECLYYAIAQNKPDETFVWLNIGADPDQETNNTLSLLHLAVGKNIEICKLLLKYNVNPNIKSNDHNGHTPLHYSILSRNEEFAIQLINYKKTDLELTDNEGKSPLYWAVFHNLKQIVSELINNGASPFKKLNPVNNKNLLHFACEKGFKEIVEYLINNPLKNEQKDNFINEKGGIYDNTPLHYAANNGYVEIVSYLLQQGADPTVKNKKEQIPYSLVCNLIDQHIKHDEHMKHDVSLTEPLSNYIKIKEILQEPKVMSQAKKIIPDENKKRTKVSTDKDKNNKKIKTLMFDQENKENCPPSDNNEHRFHNC